VIKAEAWQKFEDARAEAQQFAGSRILTKWRDERVAQRTQKVVQAQDLSGLSVAEFNEWVKGNMSTPGTVVTDRTAMNISCVYACVALIGGAIASLPLQFYKRDMKTYDRERYVPDEWWMLNEQPFTTWAAAPAWEYAAWSLLLHGDSFWRIHRASRMSPKIVGFEPLYPPSVTVRRFADRLAYQVMQQPSQAWDSGVPPAFTLDQDDMLHIPGPGFDGLRGMSQIQSALRQSGGIALSADDYMSSFFKNGARPDFAMETDQKLDKEQIATLREQWSEVYQGTAKAWKPAILSGGLKVKPITLTANDAQLLETRKFQIEDICRIFGVPPFMVGQTEKTTSWGTGIEQMSIGFVKYTLQRHLVKFEQEVNRKVFRRGDRFCEFLTAGLERGDLKSRFEAYRIALGRAGEYGWMTSNEIRRRENDLPLPGGDELNKPPEPTAAAPDDTNKKQDGEGNTDQGDANESTTGAAGE
jgi:HK97 family phage portal protein